MLMSVLRVSSATLDVDAFVAAHPGLGAVSVWHKGQTYGRRPPREDSGFNLDLGDGSRWELLLERTLARLEAIRDVLDDARAAGADLTLDFGLVVGTSEAFTRTARFSPPDLKRLLDLGVEVFVSAYPGQD
jgi:hypothetical protein